MGTIEISDPSWKFMPFLRLSRHRLMRMSRAAPCLRTVLLLVFAIAFSTVNAETRIALVIGNGNYSIPGLKLVNPSNDAVAMQNELQAAGFTVVMKLDAKRKDFYSLVRQFGDKLAGDPHAVGLFYYGGHGVQADGQNYLIPVDAEIKSEEDLDANAYPAARIRTCRSIPTIWNERCV